MLVLRVDSRNTAVIDLRPFGIRPDQSYELRRQTPSSGLIAIPISASFAANCLTRTSGNANWLDCRNRRRPRGKMKWEQRWITTDLDLELGEIDEEVA